LFLGNGHTSEDAVVAAANTVLLIVRKMRVLRNDYDVRFHLSGYAMHRVVNSLHIKCRRCFDDDMALAVTDKHLHGDLRSGFCLIRQVNDCPGDSVRHFIRVARIHFFIHSFIPFWL